MGQELNFSQKLRSTAPKTIEYREYTKDLIHKIRVIAAAFGHPNPHIIFDKPNQNDTPYKLALTPNFSTQASAPKELSYQEKIRTCMELLAPMPINNVSHAGLKKAGLEDKEINRRLNPTQEQLENIKEVYTGFVEKTKTLAETVIPHPSQRIHFFISYEAKEGAYGANRIGVYLEQNDHRADTQQSIITALDVAGIRIFLVSPSAQLQAHNNKYIIPEELTATKISSEDWQENNEEGNNNESAFPSSTAIDDLFFLPKEEAEEIIRYSDSLLYLGSVQSEPTSTLTLLIETPLPPSPALPASEPAPTQALV